MSAGGLIPRESDFNSYTVLAITITPRAMSEPDDGAAEGLSPDPPSISPTIATQECTSDDALGIASIIADSVSIPDLASCLQVAYNPNDETKSARDQIVDIIHKWMSSNRSKQHLLETLKQMKNESTQQVVDKVIGYFQRSRSDSRRDICYLRFQSSPIEEQQHQQDLVIQCPVSVAETGEIPHNPQLVNGMRMPQRYGDKKLHSANLKAVTKRVAEKEEKFSVLLANVQDSLERAAVDVKKIKTFLTSLSMSVREDIAPVCKVFEGHKNEIIAHSNLSEVFQWLTLNGFWNFLNYYLLKKLVEKYGDSEIKKEVADYEREIEDFKLHMNLVDFLPVWSGRCPHIPSSDFQPLIVKVESHREWSSYTLADVSDWEGYLESRFLLNRSLFNFANAEDGCVVIMWLVPTKAITLIKQRIANSVDKQSVKAKPACPFDAQPPVHAKTIGRNLLDSFDFQDLYESSIKNPEMFWDRAADQFLQFDKPFGKVMDCNMAEGKISWFTGGRLNVSVNCVDRHAEQMPNHPALVWLKNDLEHQVEVTFKELLEMVCQIANVLKRKGVEKGDIVAIYMPICPMTVASMLACARIGAVHSVLFSKFNTSSKPSSQPKTLQLHELLKNAKVVITADEAPDPNSNLPLKARLDDAITKTKTKIEHVLVTKMTGCHVNMEKDRDEWLEEAMMREPKECEPVPMDSEDPLFIMFTSGSSGAPKGIVHTQAGYLLHVAVTFKYYFDYKSDDVYACIADIGWITGHSYIVYGPLCNGATTVLFDNAAASIDPSCYWRMIEKVGVTKFYTTPSMIRKVMGHDRQSASCFEMPSLKLIAFVGEPLSKDARNWCFENVGKGRCRLLDTWWQTELGGICMATPLHMTHATTSEPGMKPSFGVEPLVYNEQNELDVTGKLFLKNPLPGMGRRLLGKDGEQRFKELYFKYIDGKHLYYTSDVVHVLSKENVDGYQVVGREEDVIKLAIGNTHLNIPFIEGEAAAIHKDILEVVVTAPKGRDSWALCVHVAVKDLIAHIEGKRSPVEDKSGQKIRCIEEKSSAIEEKIQNFFQRNFKIPILVRLTQELKKTYSGKVIRYILRDVEENFHRELGTGDVDADILHVEQLGYIAAADYGVEDYMYY